DGSGTDYFADVSIVKPEIEQLIREWEGTDFAAGFDRGGLDYADFDASVPSPLACKSACVADSKCRAYTYTEPRTRTASAPCWHKPGDARGARGAAAPRGVTGTRGYGAARRGGAYKSAALAEPRAELCAATCANEQPCLAYTYVAPTPASPTPMCWLKNQIPPI